MAKVIQLIEASEKRGLGTMEDPIRKVYQLWTLDGRLIMEHDPELEARKNKEEAPNKIKKKK